MVTDWRCDVSGGGSGGGEVGVKCSGWRLPPGSSGILSFSLHLIFTSEVFSV